MQQREIRSTRGQRIHELVGEEAEKDKVFWEHSTWNEDDSGNESYEENEEDDKPDVFDTDFDETEDEESSEDEEAELRKSTKRKNITKNTYKEPVAKKPTTVVNSDRPRPPKVPKVQHESDNVLSVKLRQSTTIKTLQHEQARIEASQRSKPVQRPPLPKREFSQKGLLLEALDTELKNAKWLRSQKLAEEEKNLSDKPSKAPPVEKITFLSRRGMYNTITFPDSRWPEIFEQPSSDPPENACVITGLRARYLDPVTGYPYHNLEAYKQLKEMYHRTMSV